MAKPKKSKTSKRAPGGHRPLSQPEQEYIMIYAKVAPVKQLAMELKVSESAVYRVIRFKNEAIQQAKYDLNRFLKSLQNYNVQCRVFREGEFMQRQSLQPETAQKTAA